MKQDRNEAFLAGFIPTGLVLAVILLGIIFMTFNLGGGETLQELENHRTAMLIITLLLVLGAGWIARDFISNQKKYTAKGIRVMALLCLLVVIANYVYNLTIPTEFDKVKWEQPGSKPFHMAATLVKRDTMIGLTLQEAKKLLGPGSRESVDVNTGNGALQYFVNNDWTLSVLFLNGKVVETRLRLPYLCV